MAFHYECFFHLSELAYLPASNPLTRSPLASHVSSTQPTGTQTTKRSKRCCYEFQRSLSGQVINFISLLWYISAEEVRLGPDEPKRVPREHFCLSCQCHGTASLRTLVWNPWRGGSSAVGAYAQLILGIMFLVTCWFYQRRHVQYPEEHGVLGLRCSLMVRSARVTRGFTVRRRNAWRVG